MEVCTELYRLIVENTSDLMALMTLDGDVVYTSPAYKTLLGRAPVSHVRDVYAQIHPEDVETMRHGWRQTCQGQPQRIEYRYKHVDGAWRWIELQSHRVQYQGRPHVLSVSRDVTERKHLEEHLFRVQKMEAIGRLAGGIAHDFNNLLLVIGSYAELARRGLTASDARGEMLVQIGKASERAAQLTRQLLAFSRKQVLQSRVVDVNALIEDVLRLVERPIGEDIALRVSLAPSLGAVRVDPAQLEQALINLIVNARDAMPDGGSLFIETRAGALRGGAPGVVISVRDTGHGMDADTLANIFEPFFTTKEVGKGTGLGLAMVYGFVEQSGGSIDVESRPGQGAAFQIRLPRVVDAVDERPDPAVELDSPSGSETVLLVEDDDSVRGLIRQVLESHGYAVLEARDARAAEQVSRDHRGEIHVLLTDLVMPYTSGDQLARVLARHRPGMRTLFMSGYAGATIAEPPPGSVFLAKPFTPIALASRLRDVLDASR